MEQVSPSDWIEYHRIQRGVDLLPFPENDSFFKQMNSPDESLLENRDFLFLLTTRLDNQSLEVLSHTPIWNDISQFAQEQYFWYLRSQYLVGRDLKPRNDADWKRIYYLLVAREEWMADGYTSMISTTEVVSYKPALEVFIELGDDPSVGSSWSLIRASKLGLEDVVKLLLSDSRVDPTAESYRALAMADSRGYDNILNLLLEDSKVDPEEYEKLLDNPHWSGQRLFY